MRKAVLIDSGFWFTLFNDDDAYSERARDIFEVIKTEILLVPFPTLYEALNTRLSRRVHLKVTFERVLKFSNIEILDDSDYREAALKVYFATRSSLSLVDCIIREMIVDTTLRKDYLVTFNSRDFADVCTQNKVQIFDGS